MNVKKYSRLTIPKGLVILVDPLIFLMTHEDWYKQALKTAERAKGWAREVH